MALEAVLEGIGTRFISPGTNVTTQRHITDTLLIGEPQPIEQVPIGTEIYVIEERIPKSIDELHEWFIDDKPQYRNSINQLYEHKGPSGHRTGKRKELGRTRLSQLLVEGILKEAENRGEQIDNAAAIIEGKGDFTSEQYSKGVGWIIEYLNLARENGENIPKLYPSTIRQHVDGTTVAPATRNWEVMKGYALFNKDIEPLYSSKKEFEESGMDGFFRAHEFASSMMRVYRLKAVHTTEQPTSNGNHPDPSQRRFSFAEELSKDVEQLYNEITRRGRWRKLISLRTVPDRGKTGSTVYTLKEPHLKEGLHIMEAGRIEDKVGDFTIKSDGVLLVDYAVFGAISIDLAGNYFIKKHPEYADDESKGFVQGVISQALIHLTENPLVKLLLQTSKPSIESKRGQARALAREITTAISDGTIDQELGLEPNTYGSILEVMEGLESALPKRSVKLLDYGFVSNDKNQQYVTRLCSEFNISDRIFMPVFAYGSYNSIIEYLAQISKDPNQAVAARISETMLLYLQHLKANHDLGRKLDTDVNGKIIGRLFFDDRIEEFLRDYGIPIENIHAWRVGTFTKLNSKFNGSMIFHDYAQLSMKYGQETNELLEQVRRNPLSVDITKLEPGTDYLGAIYSASKPT